MRLEDFSIDADNRLLEYVETYLSEFSPAFRQDVLHAVRITAPLRERTYLVRLAADLSGVRWEAVEPFAFAAELFIISALTADDAIDGAGTRSGQPTLAKNKGVACAMLVAEWLHALAHVVLWKTPAGVGDEVWRAAAERFHATYSSFFFHQYWESQEERNQHVTLEEVDRLSRGRTGRLLEACLASPAIISTSTVLTKTLTECGRWLGMAFQHRDDILDFIATPEIIGKPILLNLLSGQPNLVLSHALTRATDQGARNTILRYFGAARLDTDIERLGKSIQDEVLLALRATGSFTFASELVRDYCERAIKELSGLAPSPAKEELVNVISIVAAVEFPWEEE